MSDVLSELRGIFSRVFQVPAETDPAALSMANFSDWDSMAHINLILATEQAFGVQFLPEEVAEMDSFEALANAVHSKTKT